MITYITYNEKDTEKLANIFAKYIVNSAIIGLGGELGAGKTTFVKYFTKAKGGDINLVTSPTFTLINEYKLKNGYIYHIDLYRLNTIEELYGLGLEEYLEFREGISFVEWYNKFPEFFSRDMIEVSIFIEGDTKRRFEIKSKGKLYNEYLQNIKRELSI